MKVGIEENNERTSDLIPEGNEIDPIIMSRPER